jgi:hypothetical protein
MFRHRIKDLIILNVGVAILFAFAIELSSFMSPPWGVVAVAVPLLTMIVIGSLVWVEADLDRRKMQEVLRRGDVRPLDWLEAYLSRKRQGTRYHWRNPKEPSSRYTT